MLNKVIAIIASVIIVLSTIVLDESLLEDVSKNDGKYGVYINSIFYGNVSDRTKFDKYIEKMYTKYNKEYVEGEVYYPENYSIETVSSPFNTGKSESEIYEEFKKNVDFLIDGYKITIAKDTEDYVDVDEGYNGGEVKLSSSVDNATIYSTSKEEVDIAFDKILKTFVDEKSIERIERGDTIDSFDVGMEETISYEVDGTIVGSEIKVPYDSVLTGDELYEKMLFYSVKEDKTYTVKKGDTLSSIANQHMLNISEIIAANEQINNENTILSPGQEIIVNLVDPVVTVESTKIVVAEEEISYETEVIEDPNMLSTAPNIVKEEGSNGRAVRTYEIDYLNGQTMSGGKIISENKISEPVNRVVVVGTKAAPSISYGGSGISGYTKSTGVTTGIPVAWGKPTKGGYQSSNFGPRWGRLHQGIDIAGLPTGAAILTVYDGLVMFTGYQGARGNLVIIDHQNGYVTYYQHLNKIDVNAGQRVVKGQRIGGMGETGYSFGVHLHFEVFVNGGLVNPDTVTRWN